MMFAAETLPDPYHFSSIGWVCVVLVCIIIGVRQVVGLTRELKDKPSPGDVRHESAANYVAKTEFQTHVNQNTRDHENIFSKIGGVERGAKSAVEQQVEVVRRDLMKCGNDIAALQASTEMQNQSLARVEAKLDRLIERD